MSKRKAMTLDAIGGEQSGEPVAEALGQAVATGQGQRAHVKQLTLYLPHPVYDQLRELAFHERAKMHTLVMEGLDLVFADRGVASVEQLKGKGL